MAQIATNALDDAAIRRIAADLARVDPADPSTSPLRREDTRLAAQRGAVVVTTLALSTRSPAPLLPLIRAVQIASWRALIDSGVTVAVGSDNVGDSCCSRPSTCIRWVWLTSWGKLGLLKLGPKTRRGRSFLSDRLASCVKATRPAF